VNPPVEPHVPADSEAVPDSYKAMNKDVLSGAVLLLVAAAYYWATLQIPDSSLSDEVGAQGLPRILAVLLVGLALLILVRGFLASPKRLATDIDAAEDPDASPRRALGFLAIAAGYVLVSPLVGYGPALALLITAVAIYEGTKPSWRTAVIAIGGAVVFWLLFVQLLGVEQPSSALLF
jgi:putative tricarboxylic transport membrane protein